jgi:chromosome segregation ATPase
VEINSRLSKQNEELCTRLNTERMTYSTTLAENQQEIVKLEEELLESDRDREELSERLADTELNHQNLLSLFKMSEQVIVRERERVEESTELLEVKTREVDELEGALMTLEGNLEQMSASHEELTHQVEESQGKQKEWDVERDRYRGSLTTLMEEVDAIRLQREEGLEALRDTIDALKDLSADLANEKEARYAIILSLIASLVGDPVSE